MLVNERPIVAKMASFGWKMRRKIGQDGGPALEGGRKRRAVETYAEVLKGDQRMTSWWGNMNGEATSSISPLMERVLINVKDKKQLIESHKLADVCCQVQNSNKKGNGCRTDENLAIKSTYSKLRKVKGNKRVSFSSLLLNSHFERSEILEGKECGFKADGPSLERHTQSSKMKVQSGGMAYLGPASSKYISEVGEAGRSFDETEGGFDEASVDGVVRDVLFLRLEKGEIFFRS
ncbi:hypothetical protein Ddye_014456 [Dipteronia dyeriana]|uniref:Uncharacterized protein n=1 Tax=Dipteronia dyeriana TaxID=168575 RepID=A0AAD9X818_9ROSI|nr:hypothetical protein Ddye_014456 [Dipteronia dyeriana]